jgi:homoserine O-acetyltransferase
MIQAKTLFITFSSDFLFPPYQTEELCNIMTQYGGNTPEWVRIESDYGHDAFLIDFDVQTEHIIDFLNKLR